MKCDYFAPKEQATWEHTTHAALQAQLQENAEGTLARSEDKPQWRCREGLQSVHTWVQQPWAQFYANAMQTVFISTPLLHQALNGLLPRPTLINLGPNPSLAHHQPLLNLQTQHLIQLMKSVTKLNSKINASGDTSSWRPYTTHVMRVGPYTSQIQVKKKPPEAKPFKIQKYNCTWDPYHHRGLYMPSAKTWMNL